MILKLAGNSKKVGICLHSEHKKSLEVCEFEDNDYFTILEAFLLQNQPHTCYLHVPTGVVGDKMKSLVKNCNIALVEVTKINLNGDRDGDLDRLLKKGDLKRHLAESKMEEAMKASTIIVSQCNLLADDENYKSMTISQYLIDSYMRLDNAVFAALNLLPRPGEGLRTPTSLVGFLNKCRTSVGSRRLIRWISQPLTDAAEIKARHDIVQLFSEDDIFRSTFF